jgi:hypothetical protein
MRSAAHKHRDIARSILPSTSPRPARHDLAAAKRHTRRAVRADLRALRRDDYDDGVADLTRTADREINQIRRRRRARDKLNHFEHWAVRAMRDIPIEDRLGWLRSVLPAGLIGDHAMSHLRRIPELDPHAEVRYPWRFEGSDAWVAARRARRRHLAAGLRLALERPGGHRAINLALRSVEGEGEPPGPRLRGIHDVVALVDVLVPDPDRPLTRYERPPPADVRYAPVLVVLADHANRLPTGRIGASVPAPPSGGGAAVTTTVARRPARAPQP